MISAAYNQKTERRENNPRKPSSRGNSSVFSASQPIPNKTYTTTTPRRRGSPAGVFPVPMRGKAPACVVADQLFGARRLFIVTWIALQGGEIVSVQRAAIKHAIAGSDCEPATLLALHGEGGWQWFSHELNLGGTERKRQRRCHKVSGHGARRAARVEGAQQTALPTPPAT